MIYNNSIILSRVSYKKQSNNEQNPFALNVDITKKMKFHQRFYRANLDYKLLQQHLP